METSEHANKFSRVSRTSSSSSTIVSASVTVISTDLARDTSAFIVAWNELPSSFFGVNFWRTQETGLEKDGMVGVASGPTILALSKEW